MSVSPSAPSRLQHRLQEGSSGTLVVVFSQVRVPAGKFGLERLFARTRHTCLFFNDTDNGWYRGLDPHIDAVIDGAVSRANPARIIYYGSSMGGTAALAAALRRQDGGAHAFGAELRQGRPGSQSARYGIGPEDGRFPHFTGDCGSVPKGLHLYYGLFDGTDAANAAFARQRLPEAQLYPLQSSHAGHDHLYSLNLIRRIITTFGRDPALELASKGLPFQDGLSHTGAFGDAFEAFSSGENIDPAELAALPFFGGNPGLQLLRCDVLARAGEMTAALRGLQELDARISEHEVWRTLPKRWRKQVPLASVRLLMTLNRMSDAQSLFLETCGRFPVDPAMTQLADELNLTAAIRPAADRPY